MAEKKQGRPNLRLIPGGKSEDASEELRAKHLLRRPIYQLRLALVGVVPEVWRRVLVTGNISLGKLHDVIQICMGWEDSHLHQFQLDDGRRFCRQDVEPDEDAEDEQRVELRRIAPETGSAFRYFYDFGDDWIHRVIVEAIIPPQEAGRTPRCIDGRRACPPEDVGGPMGYERYLETLGDPRHPDHRETLEWRGLFDPDAFEVDRVNSELRRVFPSG